MVFALALQSPSAVAQTEVVTVRFGIHEDFDRIVFDWPYEVGYRLNRSDNEITITFDRLSDAVLVTPLEDFGERLVRMSKPRSGASASYKLYVAPGTTFTTFSYDDESRHRVIVDVADG